jgi:hypothetical protein
VVDKLLTYLYHLFVNAFVPSKSQTALIYIFFLNTQFSVHFVVDVSVLYSSY